MAGILSIDTQLERPGFSLAVAEEMEMDGITALFGPSGAGKTTLLRVIAGLEKAARGRLALGDAVWQDDTKRLFVPAHKRSIGYVFQEGGLFPHMTVLDNLRFAHRRRARREAIGIDEAIGALDLRALLHRRPASLSGGERQRVAIARALLRGPALVMMDEPLSSLDVGRKAEIIPYIERLPESFGLPVLYVTHNVEELARLATKMVLLARGRVVARGRVADLLERVDLWPVTGISEAGTVLEARVQSHADRMTALSIDGQRLLIPFIDVRPGSSVHLRVQARDVAIATAPPSGLSIRNVLAAELLSVDYSEGAYAELLLGIGSQHLRSRVTRQAVAELRLAEGQNVFALIKSVAFNGRLLG